MSGSRTCSVSPFVRESNRRADDAREERIAALDGLAHQALTSGDTAEFRRIQRELKAAVESRSPEQVIRMRRSMTGAPA